MNKQIDRIKSISETGKCDRECEDCPIHDPCHYDFSKKLQTHAKDWINSQLTKEPQQ